MTPSDPLDTLDVESSAINRIIDKLTPNFGKPSGSSFSLRVPLDCTQWGGRDFSFTIDDWSSMQPFMTFFKLCSYFIFSLIFLFGIVRALRQW